MLRVFLLAVRAFAARLFAARVPAAGIVAGMLLCGCGGSETVGRSTSQHGDPLFTGAVNEATFASFHTHGGAARGPYFGQELRVGDARVYQALPRSPGPHPGVIVVHEWWGLNGHIQHWTDRLAALGYAAVAVDLYGGRTATTPEDAMALVRSVGDAEALATLRAAAAHLRAGGARKLGVMGWCFGGGWSLRAGVEVEGIDATVMYYGRPITEPEALGSFRGPLLGIFGNDDASIPPETVDAFGEALAQAGVDHRLLRYDASHAFANPSSARYDAVAAEAAWTEVRSFFAAHLAEGAGSAEGATRL